MSSVPASSLPAITFVGRLLDPNKGILTFLDAVEILQSMFPHPAFVVWLAGGECDEVKKVVQLISSRPKLQSEYLEGRISVLGKVKRLDLPNIYRRSHVLAVPSTREPFGLVAVEAMMCGCPVVGTRVGGISDTVLEGLTGALVDPDNSDCLAAALSVYIRNPGKRNVHGELASQWARSAFGLEETYSQVARLYTAIPPAEQHCDRWHLPSSYARGVVSSILPQVVVLLGAPIEEWEIQSDRFHIVSRVCTSRGTVALKVFRDRPSNVSAFLPVCKSYSAVRSRRSLVANAEYHKDNRSVAQLLASSRENGIAVFEWVENQSTPIPSRDIPIVIEGFAEFGRSKLPRQQLPTFQTAVGNCIRQCTRGTLASVNDVIDVFQECAFGLASSIPIMHPTIELYRVRMAMESNGWCIPSAVLLRMQMTINLALKCVVPHDMDLKLCHGDLSAKHLRITKRGPIALDTECSCFAAGSLDIATWYAAEITVGFNVFDALNAIAADVQETRERNAIIQWLVYFIVRRYLARVHCGVEKETSSWAMRVLHDLSLGLLKVIP